MTNNNLDRFKYRVWDNEEKCYCDEITFHTYLIKGISYGTSLEFFINRPERFTVEQCTGLKDKNGKLIFEGDIVKDRFKTIQIVKWQDDTSGFYPFSDSPDNCGHCGGGELSKNCEIIGNIHENTELVEG